MADTSCGLSMNRRTWVDYDHAKAKGYEAYYDGETPADVPYDEFSGLVRDWWLSGWREARAEDHVSCGLNHEKRGIVDRLCLPADFEGIELHSPCPRDCARPADLDG